MLDDDEELEDLNSQEHRKLRITCYGCWKLKIGQIEANIGHFVLHCRA